MATVRNKTYKQSIDNNTSFINVRRTDIFSFMLSNVLHGHTIKISFTINFMSNNNIPIYPHLMLISYDLKCVVMQTGVVFGTLNIASFYKKMIKYT